jgi:hypothetical protein
MEDLGARSRLAGRRDPRYITVHNEDDIGFENLWVGGDGTTSICLMRTAQTQVRADLLDYSNGQCITKLLKEGGRFMIATKRCGKNKRMLCVHQLLGDIFNLC